MTKAPSAGLVKTRLVPPLTHSEAAELSICLLRDTVANMTRVAAGLPADLIAVYSPSTSEKDYDGLLPDSFSLLSQSTGPLGDRLFDAASALFSAGYTSVCLIGSDSPTLPTGFLQRAIELLGKPGDRGVLGPADDGGYYLIGLKHPHRRLFQGIEWSTERVLRQTVERAGESGLEVKLLPAWYDLDDARSLVRACQELLSSKHLPPSHDGGYPAPHTRDCLERLIKAHGRQQIWPAGPPATAPDDRTPR
jgi:rSAM/selenodomain-associated transferase 1